MRSRGRLKYSAASAVMAEWQRWRGTGACATGPSSARRPGACYSWSGSSEPVVWPADDNAPLPTVRPTDGVLRYDESIHIGQRGYDHAGIAPAFHRRCRGAVSWAGVRFLSVTSWSVCAVRTPPPHTAGTPRSAGGRQPECGVELLAPSRADISGPCAGAPAAQWADRTLRGPDRAQRRTHPPPRHPPGARPAPRGPARPGAGGAAVRARSTSHRRPKRIRGLTLAATDLDWTTGDGLTVQGPGEALLMAMAGRPAALPELSGPGTPTLAERITSGTTSWPAA